MKMGTLRQANWPSFLVFWCLSRYKIFIAEYDFRSRTCCILKSFLKEFYVENILLRELLPSSILQFKLVYFTLKTAR